MSELEVMMLIPNDYVFKKYNCRIDLYLYPGETASIQNFDCGKVGTGKGKLLLRETLDYLKKQGKLPPLLTLSASVQILAGKLPKMTETEKEEHQAKLEQYYQRLGFAKVDDPSNKKFLQKMVANTDDVLQRLSSIGGKKKSKKCITRKKKSRKNKTRKNKK